MKYREAARKLVLLGCEELPRHGGGSHRKRYCPESERITSLPDWGSKDLKSDTLRAVVAQLGLDWETFKSV